MQVLLENKSNRSYTDIHGKKYNKTSSNNSLRSSNMGTMEFTKDSFKENFDNNLELLAHKPTLNLEDLNKIEQE